MFFVVCILLILPIKDTVFINKTEVSDYTPIQIKRAYGLNNINSYGNNQTIAIIVGYGSDTISNDLSVFNEKFDLEEANLQIEYPQGIPEKPSQSDLAWIKETTMDVQWAHALAPKAKILLVVAKSSKKEDLLNAIEYATENSPDIISISWRFDEFKNEYKFNNYFNNEDIIYVAASGDNGPEVSWPAVIPNVLSVGGTTLSLNEKGQIIDKETACFNSGGGISKYIKKPDYQKDLSNADMEYRTVPDVSFFGDISKGVAIYCSNKLIEDSGWSSLSGTSLGAPCWAAFLAIANEALGSNLTNINERLYNIAKNDKKHINFNDITEGDNGEFYADEGYDCISGLGTPHFDIILKSLSSKNLN